MEKPSYTKKISIKSARSNSYVSCPDSPIIDNKYNTFFHIRPGADIENSFLNAIHVKAEAGGMSTPNAQQFGNAAWIEDQLDIIQKTIQKIHPGASLNKLGLSSFSGGYEAVGMILSKMSRPIDAVVILDGIHAGKRGNPSPSGMEKWLKAAGQAKADQNKWFIFVYTAVDPTSYASTSDSAFYLTDKLSIPRTPVDGYNISFAGIKPSSIAAENGFRAIQLFPRKNDGPGYGYPYYPDNRPGSSGYQHVMAGKCFPGVADRYLVSTWNNLPMLSENERREILNSIYASTDDSVKKSIYNI